MWCVYKHQNLQNGKIYIGITSQNPPEKRWRNGNGYYNHLYFFQAIQKYGWDNFSHQILFSNLTLKQAQQKEKELIAYYKSNNRKFGYNLTEGGEGTKGYHHTKQAKEKISNSLKGNKRASSPSKQKWYTENKEAVSAHFKKVWENPTSKQAIIEKHQKKVKCLNTGKIFNSIKEASEWAGINSSGIIRCCKKQQKTAGKMPGNPTIKLQWEYIN